MATKFLLPHYESLVRLQWDYNKNKGLDPSKISHGSTLKPFWKCLDNEDHTFPAFVHRMVRGGGCPICSGSLVVVGVNNVGHTDPDLKEEFVVPEDAEKYTRMSHKKVPFKCKQGHEFITQISSRVKGHGCKFCSRREAWVGESDIATENPTLADQLYDQSLRTKIMANSREPVEWVCTAYPEHIYLAPPYKRNSRGDGCNICSNHTVLAGYNSIEDTCPTLAQRIPNPEDRKITRNSGKKTTFRCPQGHTHEAYPYNMSDHGENCPQCFTTRSRYEEQLQEVLAKHFEDIIFNTREVILPKELDIYIPSKKFAIEFNGLYWHTEEQVGKNYHKDKTLLCQEQGISLVHLWEDDYKRNPELIHKMLLHKLGVSTSKRVFARKTTLRSVDKTQAKVFLEKNHIQGSATGSLRLGLFFEDELVAVCVFKRYGKNLQLERYATSCTVIGGQSKILRWVDKNIEYEKMVTFADLAVSNGFMYEKTGWVVDKVLEPDYMYVFQQERKHKFGFRLKRFQEDPNLQWESGLSESQLAKLNNIPRIYDAGKIRFTRVRA